MTQGKRNLEGLLWTKEQDDILREYYHKHGLHRAQQELKNIGYERSIKSISSRARYLKIKSKKQAEALWTEQELKILRMAYSRGGPASTQENLRKYGYNRTQPAIVSKAAQLMIRAGTYGHEYMSLNEFMICMHGKRNLSGPLYKRTKKFLLDSKLLIQKDTGKIKYLIREEDAFKILDAVTEQRYKRDDPNWLNTTKASKYFGVGRDYFRQAMRKPGRILHRLCKELGITTHIFYDGTFWWERHELELLKKEWLNARLQREKKRNEKAAACNASREREKVLQVRVQDRTEQGRRETSNGYHHASIE